MRRCGMRADRLYSVMSSDMRFVLPNQNTRYHKLWCFAVLSRAFLRAEMVQCATIHQGKHAVSVKIVFI